MFSSDIVSSEISSPCSVSMPGSHILFPACLGCHSKYSLANLSIYIQCRLQSKEEQSWRKKDQFSSFRSCLSSLLSLSVSLFLFHPGFLFSPSLAMELGKDKWKFEKEKLEDGKREKWREIPCMCAREQKKTLLRIYMRKYFVTIPVLDILLNTVFFIWIYALFITDVK